ncbi:MAG: hypothetical protein JOY66_02305 [Acetobacteraceae bacterium]|nr:hypothetical protein [Acetobacteraceae bacterium]
MFTIEFVVARGRPTPGVVDVFKSETFQLADAEISARSMLEKVKAKWPKTPPDGYQIKDYKGNVLLRSWEQRQP